MLEQESWPRGRGGKFVGGPDPLLENNVVNLRKKYCVAVQGELAPKSSGGGKERERMGILLGSLGKKQGTALIGEKGKKWKNRVVREHDVL